MSEEPEEVPLNEKPEETHHPWITHEIEALLQAIRGQHIGKKRQTVIRLAFARANNQPLGTVFDLPSTCARPIWYSKWLRDSAIKAAYEACYARVLDWNDKETVAIEAHYARLRRRSVAKLAADAPDALAAVMNDAKQPGSHRISAANALIGWADPKAAEQVRPASPAGDFEQTINLLSGMSNGELDSELDRMEWRRNRLDLTEPFAGEEGETAEPGQA